MCLLSCFFHEQCDAVWLVSARREANLEEDWDAEVAAQLAAEAIVAAGGVVPVQEKEKVYSWYEQKKPDLGKRDCSFWRFFCWERWENLFRFFRGNESLNENSQDEIGEAVFSILLFIS